MLIGWDFYWSLVTGKILRNTGGPVAVDTKLVWILSGPVDSSNSTVANLVSSHTLRVDGLTKDSCLDMTLKSFWELKSLGIKTGSDLVKERFTGDIKFVDGRYQVSLPWRKGHDPLPNNLDL